MTTKTTKTAKAAATEAKAEVSKVAETTKAATNAFAGLFDAYVKAGKAAVQGVVEFDKALLGFAKESLNEYANVSKETFQAKSLKDVVDLQTTYARDCIEAGNANARELVALTKDTAQQTYAPIKEVIDAYRPGKAA